MLLENGRGEVGRRMLDLVLELACLLWGWHARLDMVRRGSEPGDLMDRIGPNARDQAHMCDRGGQQREGIYECCKSRQYYSGLDWDAKDVLKVLDTHDSATMSDDDAHAVIAMP